MANADCSLAAPTLAGFDFQKASRMASAMEIPGASRAKGSHRLATWAPTEAGVQANNDLFRPPRSDPGVAHKYASPKGQRPGVQWKCGERSLLRFDDLVDAAELYASTVGSVEYWREASRDKLSSTWAHPCGAQAEEAKSKDYLSSTWAHPCAVQEKNAKQRMTRVATVKAAPRFGLGPCPARPPQMRPTERKADPSPRMPGKERKADFFPRTPSKEHKPDARKSPALSQKIQLAILAGQYTPDAMAGGGSCCPPDVLDMTWPSRDMQVRAN